MGSREDIFYECGSKLRFDFVVTFGANQVDQHANRPTVTQFRRTLQKAAVASKATTEARASCQCKLEIMRMRMRIVVIVKSEPIKLITLSSPP